MKKKKSNLEMTKCFDFSSSTIMKALNNSRLESESIFHRPSKIIESNIILWNRNFFHQIKNHFHEEVKRWWENGWKPFELCFGISTMNQMRTIESLFFLHPTMAFLSHLIESYYGSIEMELTEIITQTTRLLAAIQYSLIIARGFYAFRVKDL